MRAKTRCVWGTETGRERCTRCDERGLQCDHIRAANQYQIASVADLGHEPCPALTGIQVSADTDRMLSPAHCHSQSSSMTSQPLSIVDREEGVGDLEIPTDKSLGILLNDLGPITLHDQLTRDFGGSDVPFSRFGQIRDDAIGWGSLSPLGLLQLPGPSPFDTHTFTTTSQSPMVCMALRTLRSYPFMMLRKGMPPPFVNPILFERAEAQRDPPQCVSCSPIFPALTTKY